MSDDYWDKFSNLRAYITFMMTHLGKNLMFMGGEFTKFIEWRDCESREWSLIEDFEMHSKIHDFFKFKNHFYKENLELSKLDYSNEVFNN